MGILLPTLFLASFYASVIIGVVIVLIGALLWYMIRVEGSKYHKLQIEDAWSQCKLNVTEIEKILSGTSPLPSLFEILGIPEPRLD